MSIIMYVELILMSVAVRSVILLGGKKSVSSVTGTLQKENDKNYFFK